MPGRQDADVVAVERGGTAGRGGGDRLGGGHPHLADRERDAERQRAGEAGPGVAVGGQGHPDAGVEQPPGVGVGLPGGELHAGQQGGDRARVAQGVDVGVREVGAVVDGGQAELGGQPHPGAGAELVGVQPAREAGGRPGGEDGAGLVGVEGTGLAEGVDPAGVRRRGLQHRTGDEVDVPGRVVGVLGRDDVGTEERRLLGEEPRHREAAGLVVDGQAVAALDLQRGGALAAHLLDQPRDVGGELLVGRGAQRGDGGADAARGVGLAGHPGGELGRPVAGEDQVGVGVDEAGDHRAAAEVDALVGRRGGGWPGRPRRCGRRRARARRARWGPRAGRARRCR